MSTARVARPYHNQSTNSYKNGYNNSSSSTTTTTQRTYNTYLSPPSNKSSTMQHQNNQNQTQTHHVTPIKQNKNRYTHTNNNNQIYLSPPSQKTIAQSYSASYDIQTHEDPDSDTLDDMESQSPIHPYTKYRSPDPRTSTANINTKTPSNIRLRKPIKSLQPSPASAYSTSHSISASMSPSSKGIYRRNFKRFQPKYGYFKSPSTVKGKGKGGKKEDYTFKIILGVGLFLFAISFYYFYGDLLTFSALKQNHHAIIEFIDKYPRFSPMIFIIFECIVVGLTIPGATVLSMAAGINTQIIIISYLLRPKLFNFPVIDINKMPIANEPFASVFDGRNLIISMCLSCLRFILQSAVCVILCMVWMWDGSIYLLFIC